MKNENKGRLKSILLIALIAISCLLLFFKLDTEPYESTVTIKDYAVLHDEKFGGIYVDISIDDFNKQGFSFGDSLNVKLSNGYEMNDIPYYNGYYVDIGEMQVVGYPGYSYVKVCVNNGEDLWLKYNVDENIKITVSLNKKAKYLDIQEARDIHYTDTQGNIPDIVFANFRSVYGGKLKNNILYRSASPVDNSHNRAPVADRLIKDAKINYIVNLSDDAEELISHIKKDNFNSPYFLSLYKSNKVIPLSMSMQFKSEEFSKKLVQGLTAMSEHDGPYLVHCVEGKDRTGFVIMILSGLMGATYDELVEDYMITYNNYYDINKDTDIKRYNVIKEKLFDVMLKYVVQNDDLKNVNYEEAMEKYLISNGMSKETITKLKNKLS